MAREARVASQTRRAATASGHETAFVRGQRQKGFEKRAAEAKLTAKYESINGGKRVAERAAREQARGDARTRAKAKARGSGAASAGRVERSRAERVSGALEVRFREANATILHPGWIPGPSRFKQTKSHIKVKMIAQPELHFSCSRIYSVVFTSKAVESAQRASALMALENPPSVSYEIGVGKSHGEWGSSTSDRAPHQSSCYVQPRNTESTSSFHQRLTVA